MFNVFSLQSKDLRSWMLPKHAAATGTLDRQIRSNGLKRVLIGQFLILVSYKISYKSGPIDLMTFRSILKYITFYGKTDVATFWTNFGNIWATFYSNIWSLVIDGLTFC